MIEVINGKTCGFFGKSKIYIGRATSTMQASLLQNQFVIGIHGNREEVIQKYKQWLWKQVKDKTEVFEYLVSIAQIVKNEDNVQLVCWCKPLGCHGDVVKSCIEWMVKEKIV